MLDCGRPRRHDAFAIASMDRCNLREHRRVEVSTTAAAAYEVDVASRFARRPISALRNAVKKVRGLL